MRTLPRLLFLVTLAALLVFPFLAWGQELCMGRGDMLSTLKDRYNERLVSQGTVDGRVVELTASKGGKTWTLFVTRPGGVSCAIAAGRDWEVFPVKRGSPS